MELELLDQIVLNKLCKKDAPRLFPGEYNVDFSIHVKGKLTVGKDYERTPTVNIPLKATLALALHYAGVTGEAAANVIKRAMIEAMNAGEGKPGEGQKALEELLPQIEKWEKEVVAPILEQLPKAKCSGPITAKLEVQKTVTAE